MGVAKLLNHYERLTSAMNSGILCLVISTRRDYVDDTEVVRYLVVPQRFDENGKYIVEVNDRMPLGYHHIFKIYRDASFFLVATLLAKMNDDKALAVTKVIAGDLPIVSDPHFYNARVR